MAELTMGQAAVSVGKSRQALYRLIASGSLSVTKNHAGVQVVDTSELIRVFGSLRADGVSDVEKTGSRPAARTGHKKPDVDVVQAMELGELRASAKYLAMMIEAAEARASSAEQRAVVAEQRVQEIVVMNQALLTDLRALVAPEQEEATSKKGKRKLLK